MLVLKETLVAAVESTQDHAKSGKCDLGEQQRGDPWLWQVIAYLETGALPSDGSKAREFAVSGQQYVLLEGVLYHVERDKTLRVIPPECDRRRLFDEVHGGAFGGHLRDAKIHGELSKRYWWPKMRGDIIQWCQACLVCASRQVGHPPLTPIPVASPFDCVGVDVLHFSKSAAGNQYAVVFVDYLTKWPEVFTTPNKSALTIAKLLVETVVSRHGVPAQLLSDRGAAFLSQLMKEVCKVLGVKKVNTTV